MPDLRIAVVGPESSGKTTLATALGRGLTEGGYRVRVIAEQGRRLAEELPPGHPWSWREQRVTSRMHVAEESRALLLLDQIVEPTALIADGTAATPLVWHMCAVRTRRHYDAGSPQITEELLGAVEQAAYDVIMVTRPDIPWVPDGIRDDPDGRDLAFETYLSLYPDAVVISGEDRLTQAISAIGS